MFLCLPGKCVIQFNPHITPQHSTITHEETEAQTKPRCFAQSEYTVSVSTWWSDSRICRHHLSVFAYILFFSPVCEFNLFIQINLYTESMELNKTFWGTHQGQTLGTKTVETEMLVLRVTSQCFQGLAEGLGL